MLFLAIFLDLLARFCLNVAKHVQNVGLREKTIWPFLVVLSRPKKPFWAYFVFFALFRLNLVKAVRKTPFRLKFMLALF